MFINQVCVIGSGVMGSGIAAQVANSGVRVLLLDVVSREKDRSSIARSSVAKMHNTKPRPLSHPKRAELITVGNLDDDLALIKDCDLVIEVIVEKLDAKHELYNKLLPYLTSKTILVSNTSTIPLAQLVKNLPVRFAQRFMITHFFNPPRYMPLLELITDQATDSEVIKNVSEFVTKKLGKSIVRCNDTPGFIANRIGCFLLELVLSKSIEYKLDIDAVDYILIQKLTLPTTGIFGLYDLIGLDLMSLIAESLLASLPTNDRFAKIYTKSLLVKKMIEEGYTGRKGLGGFYRTKKEGSNEIKEVIDLQTGVYREVYYTKESKDLDSNKLSKDFDKAITQILSEFESYIRSLIPEVTENPDDIDRAMKLGYSWKFGPFELFGSNNKKASIDSNSAANLSVNDQVFDINTKMNCLTHDSFHRLMEAIQDAETIDKPLYIYSEKPNFSAGADLKFLLQKTQDNDWQAIEDYLKLGQKTMLRVKYAKIPVIACAKGFALGGGCELLLHSRLVVANQQLRAGLVEVSLGLIPAFGGMKEMVLRSSGDKKLLIKLLDNILKQNKGTSADYFSEDYLVPIYLNMNEDYLLEEALLKYNHQKKQDCLVNGRRNHNSTPSIKDSSFNKTLNSGVNSIFLTDKISLPHFSIETDGLDNHTKSIAKYIEGLSGKEMDEKELLAFEREIFMKLIGEPLVKTKILKILS